MGAAYFYHLTRAPVEVTLPALLARARGAGWRVAIRGKTEDRLEWLDDKLWQGDGFLAHGRAGGEFDGDQPILLTTGTASSNSAQCLMVIDGAEVSAEEVSALERTCILFDGNVGDALSHARDQWRALTKADCVAQYWSQESGRWEMKAESGG